MAWAVEAGVTKGMTYATFVPNDTCTRGQVVTFQYRAMKGKRQPYTHSYCAPGLYPWAHS